MDVPDHVSGNQFGDLPMFLSAGELQSYVTNSVDNDRYPTNPDSKRAMNLLWDWKEEESLLDPSEGFDGGGVYASIKDRGYDWDNPVEVDHRDPDLRVIVDGHHRIAAAARLERETGNPIWIPIKHSYRYPRNKG